MILEYYNVIPLCYACAQREINLSACEYTLVVTMRLLSDAVAKWINYLTVDQKPQVRIPPVASEVLSLLFLPLGDQPFAESLGGKSKHLCLMLGSECVPWLRLLACSTAPKIAFCMSCCWILT